MYLIMALNLQEEYNKTNIEGIINQLEEDLVGLAPVKARIKEIAALLLVQPGGTSAPPFPCKCIITCTINCIYQ